MKSGRSFWFILLVIYLTVGKTSAQPTELSPRLKGEILDSISQAIDEKAYVYGVDFTYWKAIAASRRSSFEKAHTNDEFARDVNTAFGEFGISHLDLRTPESVAERRTGNNTSTGIYGHSEKHGFDIYTVRRGSPAETAGLRAGDFIVSVDGKPAPTNGVGGTIGQQLNLEVRRGKKLLRIPLKINKWALPPDSLEWLNNQTAMIGVRSFGDAHYDRHLMEKLFEETRRAKTVAIDLRGNGGGNSDNVMHLLNLILPTRAKAGTFVEKADVERFKTRFKREPRNLAELVKYGEMRIEARDINDDDVERFKVEYKREPETIDELIKFAARPPAKIFTGKILVVTDRSCGSGAEVFSQAVKDLGRGKIIGEHTLGKVLLADSVKLPGNFELHIVTADYVTVKGKRIERNGVEPDIKLNSEAVGNDRLLKKSILKILALKH